MKRRKKTACMDCGAEYLHGNLHRCQAGYDNVMASQNKIREQQQLWHAQIRSEKQAKEATPTDPPDWPMTTADPEVRWYINELHEMILDLNLRIADLEEERG